VVVRIDIGLDDVDDDFLRNLKVRDDVESTERLKAWKWISQIFRDPMKDEYLHIVVRPPFGGECSSHAYV
jgi:hypothetical protein